MNREITDTFLVARHDLQDSLQSRRLIVWVLLYLCVAVAGTYIFSRALRGIENQIAKTASVDTSKETGRVVVTLQQSESFRKIVLDLIDDKEIAQQILTLHPLIIFFAWFTFSFMPLLVIIISSDTIARDINSRHVRFYLFRTSRPAYALGKSLSAAVLLLIALSASAAATYITGAFNRHAILELTPALHMLWFLIKCWFFMLSYLGIALMASQLQRSPLQAQFLALLIFFILSILHPIALSKAGPGLARLWHIAITLAPSSHVFGLWHPDLTANLKSVTWCLGLGFLYFFIGFLRFSRRDV